MGLLVGVAVVGVGLSRDLLGLRGYNDQRSQINKINKNTQVFRRLSLRKNGLERPLALLITAAAREERGPATPHLPRALSVLTKNGS